MTERDAGPSGSRPIYICDGCGSVVWGTIGGFCLACRRENEDLDALRQALARMELLVEGRRYRRRQAIGNEREANR